MSNKDSLSERHLTQIHSTQNHSTQRYHNKTPSRHNTITTQRNYVTTPSRHNTVTSQHHHITTEGHHHKAMPFSQKTTVIQLFSPNLPHTTGALHHIFFYCKPEASYITYPYYTELSYTALFWNSLYMVCLRCEELLLISCGKSPPHRPPVCLPLCVWSLWASQIKDSLFSALPQYFKDDIM